MGKGRKTLLRAVRWGGVVVLIGGSGCVDQDPARTEEEAPLVADVGCAIVTCPREGACCSEIFAKVTDSESADYARRDDLIESVEQTLDGVRVVFTFATAGQRGGIVFNLTRSVSLYQLDLSAVFQGPGVQVGTLALSDAVGRGCIFSAGASASGSAGAVVEQVALTDDQFCYNGGVPGQGSVLEISISSGGAGQGVIDISQLALLAPELLGG
jgi:hypothetical protein